MNLVILDDGHGINTLGKRTPDGYLENNFNRAVIEVLRELILTDSHFDVFLTANEKHDVPLTNRVSRANEAYKTFINKYPDGKCVLISVHFNALSSEWNMAEGIEVYYNTPLDKKFADVVHKNVTMGTAQKDRGVKQKSFYILKANMPSCLVECGFMTNKKEAVLMQSNDYIIETATELYMALCQYFKIDEPCKAEYHKTSKGTHIITAPPLSLNVARVQCKTNQIPSIYKYHMNGTFLWYQDAKRTVTYPTSILYHNNRAYQTNANHILDGRPQSCLIIYNSGKVDMKRLKYLKDIDLTNVRTVIGGLGLVNKKDSSFKYSPVAEGFSGKYSDVLRYTRKTVLGYHEGENKMYLLSTVLTHDSLVKLCAEPDETKGFNFTYAISLDGGGSSEVTGDGVQYVKGDGRYIDNIIYFD